MNIHFRPVTPAPIDPQESLYRKTPPPKSPRSTHSPRKEEAWPSYEEYVNYLSKKSNLAIYGGVLYGEMALNKMNSIDFQALSKIHHKLFKIEGKKKDQILDFLSFLSEKDLEKLFQSDASAAQKRNRAECALDNEYQIYQDACIQSGRNPLSLEAYNTLSMSTTNHRMLAPKDRPKQKSLSLFAGYKLGEAGELGISDLFG